MKKVALWIGVILPNLLALGVGIFAFVNSQHNNLMVYFWLLMIYNVIVYFVAKQKGIDI